MHYLFPPLGKLLTGAVPLLPDELLPELLERIDPPDEPEFELFENVLLGLLDDPPLLGL
jgi:hypothetical protein